MSRTTRRFTLPRPAVPAHHLAVVTAAAMALSLVVGHLGQRALDRRGPTLWGWALLAGGAVAFALLARREALEPARQPPGATPRALPLVPLLAALGLAALAFPGFAGNRFRLVPTLTWLAALAVLYLSARSVTRGQPSLAAAREPEQEGAGGQATRPGQAVGGLWISWHALALLGILVVAALLRLYQLDMIPREMGVDMPLKYQNAREIMQGQFMIFCPRYPGRESLYHYLLAAYGVAFGLSYFGIKFVCVSLGLATVVALYALARYIFGREVGLVAAGFLAVSKWHVILSRTGYRAVMMPLMVALVMLTAARALRRGRSTDFVVAGLALGLGTYTYNAFLIVPPVLAVVLVAELALRGRQACRGYGWGILGLALAALLVYLPLGRYALESPGSYMFRVATRVTGVEVPLPAHLARVFLGNLWRAGAMFNLRGDGVSFINVPQQRELGAVSGVLLVFGLAYALVRWRHGHNAAVVILLAGLLLPTALALAFPHEVPNAVRASGALTPAYLLVALPLPIVARRLARCWPQTGQVLFASLALAPWGRWRWRKQLTLSASTVLLVLAVALAGLELRETWVAYLRDYVRYLPRSNYAISLELARVLDDFAREGPAYVKVWPYWYDGNALRAQLRVKDPSWDWELAALSPDLPPLSTVRGRVLFIVHPEDEQAMRLLQSCFPRWATVEHRDNNGRVAFVAFYGER